MCVCVCVCVCVSNMMDFDSHYNSEYHFSVGGLIVKQ